MIIATMCSLNLISQTSTTDPGVVINGVKWATRNVDDIGKFASSPESSGKFYQWNRKKAWTTIGESVSGWDYSSTPTGTSWTRTNDPCPAGWRVPTKSELQKLIDAGSTWTTRNGIKGCLFGTAPNQIFLPAVGYRGGQGGTLRDVTTGHYWSKTHDVYNEEVAYLLLFWSHSVSVSDYLRVLGYCVRCVAE